MTNDHKLNSFLLRICREICETPGELKEKGGMCQETQRQAEELSLLRSRCAQVEQEAEQRLKDGASSMLLGGSTIAFLRRKIPGTLIV